MLRTPPPGKDAKNPDTGDDASNADDNTAPNAETKAASNAGSDEDSDAGLEVASNADADAGNKDELEVVDGATAVMTPQDTVKDGDQAGGGADAETDSLDSQSAPGKNKKSTREKNLRREVKDNERRYNDKMEEAHFMLSKGVVQGVQVHKLKTELSVFAEDLRLTYRGIGEEMTKRGIGGNPVKAYREKERKEKLKTTKMVGRLEKLMAEMMELEAQQQYEERERRRILLEKKNEEYDKRQQELQQQELQRQELQQQELERQELLRREQ